MATIDPRFVPEIVRAVADDAPALHELQRLAYRSEAELYGDWTIPPLTEPLVATEGALAAQVVLKAGVDRRIAGAVRGLLAGDGTCHIGRLIVHPEMQGRGLGARLMRALETALPGVRRFELFTGEKSTRNLYLYAKLGYLVYRTEPLSPQVTLLYLEKRRG